MKKTSILLLFLIHVFFSFVNAQVNNEIARHTFAEKIYLQTDSQIYTANSTIWFKAIVVNAATLTGVISSGVLYVDLINEKDEVVNSKIIKLTKGLGNGHFDVASSIEHGLYRVRAYTEWNKNFLNDFVFIKPIQIVTDEFKAEPIEIKNSQNKILSLSDKALSRVDIDVQFFPEGGKLIHNISSKVGFKAIDQNGMGVPVEGEVLDDTNAVVAQFKSNSLGMGHFIFNNPNSSKIYKSRITAIHGETTEKIVSLPKIYNEGLTMQVYDDIDYINIEFNSNSYLNDIISLKGYSRGITYLDEDLKLENSGSDISIPKTDFPEGIIVFAVYDQQSRIIAERLYFNKNGMSSINISAKLNKQTFNVREEVVISMQAEAELKSTNTNNFDTSVLVLDKSRIDMEDSQRGNVLTYLLLTTDLKGHIESPHVYFETDSAHNIDDLMLTQGWRNYKYDNTINNVFEYRKEMGIPFKGIVKTKQSKVEDTSKDFVVMDLEGELALLSMTLNVPSNFYFEIEDLMGDFNKILMQPSNANEKESSIDVVMSKKPTLAVEKHMKGAAIVNETIYKDIIKKQSEIMQIEKDYFENLYGSIQLDEVEVYGYTMTPKRREMAEKYGLPDTVIDGEDIRKNITYSDRLGDVLVGFGDKVVINSVIRPTSARPTVLRIGTARGGKCHVNMVVVDGIPVNEYSHYLVEEIPASEVTSFEIIDDPQKIKFLYAEVFNTIPPSGLLLGSILSIYTRNGKGLFGALKPNKKQSIFNVQGFSPTKEFYIPRYDVEDNFYMNKPDYRQTIYWEPHVQMKDSEKALVKFYHSDNKGDFVVVLETISKEGKIGYAELEYSVQENNTSD
ncbi:hypothetical protein [Winogradskyella sp.]|uniref:hypothetical protein n=1 Tax=Winogradskyella sp. TaxID=1883156 RepID=UPI00261A1BBD|nr:hypothetical protein [Winogradskyella sp.]